MNRLSPDPKPHARRAGRLLVFGIVWLGLVSAALAGAPAASTLSGEVMRGWRSFHEKQCISCHAIWGRGGKVGPDLGRSRTELLSDGRLAGVMWNHIPKMLARMKQAGQQPITLTTAEMADLFALIQFVRQLDEPGDPVRGERILHDKGCAECHSIDTEEGTLGPDLAAWGGEANPVAWAQMMWEHAPIMEEAMERLDMDWPKLEGDDLIHIVAYVRSAGISGEKTYLRPGSVAEGRRLFLEKKCDGCHPGTGPDLGEADLPTSVGSLAASMWNHSPAMARVMRELEQARQEITPQELADVLVYVLSLGQRDRGGDPARGARIFEGKGCARCHETDEVLDGAGPTLRELGKTAAPVSMATALWNHGETMLDQMTEAGLAWPMFDDAEMVDLLAYLSEVGGSETAGAESKAPLKKESR